MQNIKRPFWGDVPVLVLVHKELTEYVNNLLPEEIEYGVTVRYGRELKKPKYRLTSEEAVTSFIKDSLLNLYYTYCFPEHLKYQIINHGEIHKKIVLHPNSKNLMVGLEENLDDSLGKDLARQIINAGLVKSA